MWVIMKKWTGLTIETVQPANQRKYRNKQQAEKALAELKPLFPGRELFLRKVTLTPEERKARAKANRQALREAMDSIGAHQVRGALGGRYWE